MVKPAGAAGGGDAAGDSGADAAPRVEVLFSALDEQLRGFALHKALATADQILALVPADEDALRAKASACMHADLFSDALTVLAAHPAVAAAMPVEHAYCLYRSGRQKEALALLQEQQAQIAPERAVGAAHLRAQLLYRAGAFEDCISTYDAALQAGQLGALEARANLVAAYIAAGRATDVPALMSTLDLAGDDSFEVAYNAGCASLAQGRLRDARQQLQLAMRMGREALLEEDYSEAEAEEELLPIAVQLAYLDSLQGRKKHATEAYTRLLKLKPTDAASAAVAANNLVAERGSHELFDGLKRLDRLLERGGAGTSTQLVEVLESRLSEEQKQALSLNRATLLLHSNKVEQCRELLNALAARFPDNSVVCMLNAAVLVREKRVAKADEVLGAFLSSRKTSAPPAARVLLMRAQLSAAAGDWQRTLVSLCELEEPLRYTPRLVATCVALHEQLGAPERAEELVDAALAFWDSCARSGGDSAAAARAACFARAAAELKQRHGRHAEAVVLYERLLHGAKSEESRAKALAGLVLACAHTDLVAAERYAAQLVPSGAAPELDAEELEAGIAFTKHADPVAPDVAAGAKRDAGAEAPQRAERRKRKRKPLYPKGFDPTAPGNPPPDPERWLPRRERSTFKGKRRTKAQQLRGAQGATPGAVAAAAQPAPAAPAAESKSKGKKGRR